MVPTSGPARSRRLTWVVVLVVVATLAAVGVLAPRVVRSPAQVAAARSAPDLPPATAVVERRVLASTVTLRGTVTSARRTEVSAVAATDGQAVVTGVRVKQGQRVRSGQVLVEVSGRPVVLLEGALPAYRDLRTGAHGPDVAQLQKALEGLGYAVSDPSGTFGSSTTSAVRRLYADRGYDPPEGAPKDEVRLPIGEVAFLAGLPGRVDRIDATLGARPTAALLTVSSGRAVVTGTLAPGDRALVRPGQAAEIESELLGTRTRGTVASVGRLEERNGVPGHPIAIRPTGALDPRLLDADVRVTIAAARTSGPVLVVPLSAVTARADGSSVVSVVGADGAARVVRVRLGLDADGSVAVTPEGGDLRAGDHVVVGVGPAAAEPAP